MADLVELELRHRGGSGNGVGSTTLVALNLEDEDFNELEAKLTEFITNVRLARMARKAAARVKTA